MIRFGAEICGDLALANSKEWLETNGLGGFASSTITGLNTRRYHGLLVAATHPPAGRMVLLSKCEETLVVNGRRFDLSSNRYPGVVHPQGHQHLREFRLDPSPVFVYEAGGIQVEKRIWMVQGENTTVVDYSVTGGECTLEVRPLMAFRDFHATTHRNGALNPTFDQRPSLLAYRPYEGVPTLYLSHNARGVEPAGNWYFNFEYEMERERGLDFQEDLFNPFLLTFEGSGRIVVSTLEHPAEQPTEVSPAGQFIVRRGEGKSVIAGYHWFGDWGRDTMIVLPSLRREIARDILFEFARFVDQGMLPNRFPDAGEAPEYNTVDATLWFFEAIRAARVTELTPVLEDIVEWHIRGTRYGIGVDPADGLVRCGEPGVQLTWMDAKVGDWVVTPRHGKPVEIQALWYNALCILADLTGKPLYRDMAGRAAQSFNAQFWNEPESCLYDVVDGAVKDGAIRPNQIFAGSLHHTMIAQDRAAGILAAVERDLLTPYGLRTLSPRDSRYQGRYEGGVAQRDGAYHQGTVWPWLLGAYSDTCLRVRGTRPPISRELEEHLAEAGLNHISEIFNGDPPHHPRGCIAQAWSLAEILRVTPPPAKESAESSSDSGTHKFASRITP